MKILLVCVLLMSAVSGWAQSPAIPGFPQLADDFLPSVPTSNDNDGEYRVGQDDVLDITVFEIPELGSTARVTAAGLVSVELVGPVQASGLTTLELARNIEDELREEFIKDPHVTVMVREYASQPVSLIGAVASPGIYQIKGSKSLLEMLAMAGGLQEGAGSAIQVLRKPVGQAVVPKTITVNTEDLFEFGISDLNIAIHAGDVIHVLEAGTVFVTGDVVAPGEFVLRNGRNVTVTQAVALGRGFAPNAKKSDCVVYRYQRDGSREEIVVNVDDIMKGDEADFTMLPNDILYVPSSGTKAGLRRAFDAAVGVVTGRLTYGF